VLQRGLFDEDLISATKTEVAGDNNILSGLLQPSDLLSNCVRLKNTEYRCNLLVVLEVSSQDKITVGWIKQIVLRRKAVFFLVTTKVCYRHDLEYFESVPGSSPPALVLSEKLRSYRPLIPRGTEESFVFFLYGKLIDDDL
jgi:hypothetical protein